MALGGSISGERGVGQLEHSYVERQVGARELGLERGIEQVFDPLGILNPGRGY